MSRTEVVPWISFAEVSRPKREANHQIVYAADVNALVHTFVLTEVVPWISLPS